MQCHELKRSRSEEINWHMKNGMVIVQMHQGNGTDASITPQLYMTDNKP
uniref:Uncharacterized protein n=1 Tax=Picea glauca TaxID=3330 RepID=A0A101LTL2_PICGL|nr:hypothetical protein ABT39_MTgene4055 [Picea glauca]